MAEFTIPAGAVFFRHRHDADMVRSVVGGASMTLDFGYSVLSYVLPPDGTSIAWDEPTRTLTILADGKQHTVGIGDQRLIEQVRADLMTLEEAVRQIELLQSPSRLTVIQGGKA